MSKTIYIAGKITGDPNYREKFNAVQRKLEAEGYIVLNPAVLPSEGFTHEAYLRMSEAMLIECDEACFLPDWQYSRGARREFVIAAEKNMEIRFL